MADMVKGGAAAAKRIAARWIPKGAVPVLEAFNGSALLVFPMGPSGAGFGVIAFDGTAMKPSLYTWFRTEKARMDAILEWKRKMEVWDAHKATKAAKNAADKAAWSNPLKPGDVLYTSWGYDQTNVDFYGVTKVAGSRVYMKPVSKVEIDSTGYMSGTVAPWTDDAGNLNFVGDEFFGVAKPNWDGKGVSVGVKGHHGSLFDGKPKHYSSYH